MAASVLTGVTDQREVILFHTKGTCSRPHKLRKGRILRDGRGLVEVSPSYENGNKTLVNAERLLCDLIGATVRAGYYD